MERATISIETPVQKHKVEFWSFLTGRDKIEFAEVGNDVRKANDYLISATIASVNGEKDKSKIHDLVLDMHGADYDFVINKAFEIGKSSSLTPEKKTS